MCEVCNGVGTGVYVEPDIRIRIIRNNLLVKKEERKLLFDKETRLGFKNTLLPRMWKEVVNNANRNIYKTNITKKNMTQQELADKSGIPKTHISQIISGTIKIEALRARKIEKALDLRKYELVEIVGFPTNNNDKRKLEELE